MRLLRYILLFISLNFVNSAFAQNTFEVEFENGKKKTFTMEYDNPRVLPRWRIGASIFGFNVIEEGGLSLTLRGEYRFSPSFYVDGLFSFPIVRSLDGELLNRKDDKRFKTTKIFNTLGHLTVIGKNIVKDKKLSIDYEYSGSTTTVYNIEFPRTINRSMLFDFGIHSFTHPSSEIVPKVDITTDGYYLMATHRSISLQTGLSYSKSESYRMNTGGNKRSYFRYKRLYVNVLYAFVNNGDIYFTKNQEANNTKATSGFEKPITENFGFLYGGLWNFGAKNSANTFWFGVQFGVLPHQKAYLDPSGNGVPVLEPITATGYFSIQYGFSFGGKLNPPQITTNASN